MDIQNSHLRLASPPRIGRKQNSAPKVNPESVPFSEAASKPEKKSFLGTLALGGLALTALAGCQSSSSVSPVPATQEHISIQCEVACALDSAWLQNPELTALPEGSPRIGLLDGEVQSRGTLVAHLGKGIVMDRLGNVAFAPDLVNPAHIGEPAIDLSAEVANEANLTYQGGSFTADRRYLDDDARLRVAHDLEYNFSDRSATIKSPWYLGYTARIEDDGIAVRTTSDDSLTLRIEIQDGDLVVSREDIGVLSTISHNPQTGTYSLRRLKGLREGRMDNSLVRLAAPEETSISFELGEIRLTHQGSAETQTFTSPRFENSETRELELSESGPAELSPTIEQAESGPIAELYGNDMMDPEAITQSIVVNEGGTSITVVGDPVINITNGLVSRPE